MLPDKSRDAKSSPRSSGATRAEPHLILIVEDEEPLRRALERVLSRMGFAVLSEPDGAKALKTYTSVTRRPDLVILDLGMPVMSGWECLEKLRIVDTHARVLVATGYGGDDLESRASSLGAAGLLMKPYDLAALGEKVRAILGIAESAHVVRN